MENGPPAGDSYPRKKPNRVYNAARWGPWAATMSLTAPEYLPNQVEAVPGRSAILGRAKDGFVQLIQFFPGETYRCHSTGRSRKLLHPVVL